MFLLQKSSEYDYSEVTGTIMFFVIISVVWTDIILLLMLSHIINGDYNVVVITDML
jgi:hypothetical protein